MQSLTERKSACRWSIVYTMNYYCHKKFNTVEFEWPDENNITMYSIDSVYNRPQKDYNCFLEEHIFFKGDTIYMIAY